MQESAAHVAWPNPNLVEYCKGRQKVCLAAELCAVANANGLIRIYLPLAPKWEGGKKLKEQERTHMLDAIQETMKAQGLKTMFTLAMG